ncbi:MAG: hypothetical protein FJY73_09560 [Candidatus Eisenbacteria bacterium]|nr:hypothetical protein [Candidatus Eisenbacteria bacterium]
MIFRRSAAARFGPLFILLFLSLPAALAAEERPFSVQMHIHGLSNHNGAVRPASMQWHTWYAKESGLDVLWWTDHVEIFEMYDTLTIDLSRAEIDSSDLSVRLTSPQNQSRRRKDLAGLAASVSGGKAAASLREGYAVMEVASEAGSEDTARFAYRPEGERGMIRRMTFARPLLNGLLAKTKISTPRVDPSARVFFRFLLSWRNYGAPVSYEIRYHLAPGAVETESQLLDPSTVLVSLPWTEGDADLSFDLTAAARLLQDGEDASLREIEWGVQAWNGASAALGVRSLLLWNPVHDPASFLAGERRLADKYEREYGVVAHVGAEYSWVEPHLNAFYPDSALAPSLFNRWNRGRPVHAWVAEVHEKGGAVSLNHPFGVAPRLARDDEEKARLAIRDRAEKILSAGAYGADIIEVGYSARGGRSLRDHLALWDRLTARGLFLYGDGTSDSHGDIWFGTESPNWFVTWIWAEDNSAESLLRGMRAGRMSFGDISRWDGAFDFRVGPYRCGDRAALPGGTLPLRVRLDPFPAGAKVRLVQGLIDESEDEVAYLRDRTEIDPSQENRIALDRPCFVRLEVYLAAAEREGEEIPLLFSNPIVFR